MKTRRPRGPTHQRAHQPHTDGSTRPVGSVRRLGLRSPGHARARLRQTDTRVTPSDWADGPPGRITTASVALFSYLERSWANAVKLCLVMTVLCAAPGGASIGYLVVREWILPGSGGGLPGSPGVLVSLTLMAVCAVGLRSHRSTTPL